MAFQLFVQPTSGQSISKGIESLGDSVGSKLQQERDWASEAKVFKKHAEAINDMMGDQSPYKSIDFNGLSNKDLANMARESQRDVSEFMAFKQQQVEQKAKEAEMQKTQAYTRAINLGTDITEDERARLNASKGMPQTSTPFGAALAEQGIGYSALKKDISTLGLDKDYEDFKNAYIKTQNFQARAAKSYKEKAENEKFWNAPGNNIPGTIGKLGIGAVGLVTGLASGYTPKSEAPEMSDEEKASLLKLHQITSNPAKAQAYMEAYRAETAGVPQIAGATDSGLILKKMVAGPSGTRTTFETPKK